jgi:hypothetical protein
MMADWTTLPNTAVGVGGLPSGTTVTALRDNPIAIAEGAAGAPRVRGKALGGISMGAIVVTGTGGQGYSGCDGFGLVWSSIVGRSLANRTLRARYSSDNGSTYGSWQNIVICPNGPTGSFSGSMRLNLQSGVFYFSAAFSVDPTLSPDDLLFSASGTHTVPSSCNAFQLGWDVAANTMNADFFNLGGIA